MIPNEKSMQRSQNSLNKQRIKAAQQLPPLSTNDSIEDIRYKVGYSNVLLQGFCKLCGK